jgi:hypothetical protein
MILRLPEKTRKLLNEYLTIKLGRHTFSCPYYQNVSQKKANTVYVGKGLPDEIKKETIKLFNDNFDKLDTFSLRLYMVMAGLGIDCSGFAVRILDSLLNETRNIRITSALSPLDSSAIGILRYKTKPYTNISANMLTNKKNTIIIDQLGNVVPGDLLRFGRSHVAVVVEVEKNKNLTKRISYAHSTSDYFDTYGVRIGNIFILKDREPLEKQKWDEVYKEYNWTLQDYINSPVNDRGFRRLKILSV